MKKPVLNVITGVGYQVITMILGFIVPRLFLLQYGSEVNGLISSSSQLLAYLSLFEAGIGSAAIQALYGFLGRKDIAGINGVMSATHRYYSKIGWFYLSGTMVLALFYPFFINTTIPYIEIFSIVACSGIAGAISFFTYSKYTLLLNAENNVYMINSVSILTLIASGLLKLYLIGQSVNIIIIQLSPILFALIQSVIYKWQMKNNHAWIDITVLPDNESISQKNAALLHQIASLVSSNTDMLLITFFIGLKSVSVYGLYNLVFSSVGTLINNFYSGIRSKLGQMYSSDIERYKSLYQVFEILFTAGACAVILTAFVTVIPFIKMYTAGVYDIKYVDNNLPLFFTLIQLLIALRLPIFDTVYFAGHIKATRWHTVTEASINLVVSLILVKPLGIYGVLIGTVVALVFRTGIMFKFVLKQVEVIDLRRSIKVQLLNVILFTGGAMLIRRNTYVINSFPGLVLSVLFYLVLFGTIFLTINGTFFIRTFRIYRSTIKAGRS